MTEEAEEISDHVTAPEFPSTSKADAVGSNFESLLLWKIKPTNCQQYDMKNPCPCQGDYF